MHQYFVELRIYGTDLDPSTVSADLGLEPSTVRHVGDTIGTRRITRAEWGYNGSGADSPAVWESLEEGLRSVMSHLVPVRAKLEEYESRFEVIWWCGHFQSGFDGGPTLSPSVLKELAEFGVPLFIDNYFSDDLEPAEVSQG